MTTAPAWDTFPALAPDRESVIYVRSRADGGPRFLRVVADNGEGDRPLFQQVPPACAGGVSRPAWNPVDPTMLAAVCTDGDAQMGVFLLSTDGELLQQIDTGDDTTFGDPTFSPDGVTVTFWGAPDNSYDGGVLKSAPIDASGTATQLLPTSMPGQDADPAYSPDGRSLAFRRRAGTAKDRADLNVWVMDLASKKLSQLTHSGADDQDPSWSPDGTEIAFKSKRNAPDWPGQTEQRIWVSSVDGATKRVLWPKKGAGEQTAASWTHR